MNSTAKNDDGSRTTSPATMTRAVYNRFGDPEVLELECAPVPEPKKAEVRVRMLATSVNGGDLDLRRGSAGLVSRLTRFPQTFGIDVVGIVDKLGPGVVDLEVGDMVWGNAGPKADATAEYITIRSKYIAQMPRGLDPTTAAALPTAGITALTALVRKGHTKPGDRVLIRGTGGVGLAAVQIAKALGAHVTTLSSGSTLADVKSYGADETYDYTTMTAGDLGQFDVIFDTSGPGLEAFRRNLQPHGRMLTIVVGGVFRAALSLLHGRHRTRVVFAFADRDVLDHLARLVEGGSLRPVIDSVYPMDRVADAHRRAETRGLLGKVVISIARP